MKKRNAKKGFTIVELVIVIAVIAILAAVLIPTFGGVVKNANDSADLQEARNAYTLYLIDHEATPAAITIKVKGGYVAFDAKGNPLVDSSDPNSTKDYTIDEELTAGAKYWVVEGEKLVEKTIPTA